MNRRDVRTELAAQSPHVAVERRMMSHHEARHEAEEVVADIPPLRDADTRLSRIGVWRQHVLPRASVRKVLVRDPRDQAPRRLELLDRERQRSLLSVFPP